MFPDYQLLRHLEFQLFDRLVTASGHTLSNGRASGNW